MAGLELSLLLLLDDIDLPNRLINWTGFTEKCIDKSDGWSHPIWMNFDLIPPEMGPTVQIILSGGAVVLVKQWACLLSSHNRLLPKMFFFFFFLWRDKSVWNRKIPNVWFEKNSNQKPPHEKSMGGWVLVPSFY